MRRIPLYLRHYRPFSSKSEALYSFLEPTLFSVKKPYPTQPVASSDFASCSPQGRPESLTLELKSTLETTLHKSIITNDTDEAWKTFKALTSYSAFPNKSLTNSLIKHLSSLSENHNLKRAFASTIYVIEKDPHLIDFGTVVTLLNSIKCANTPVPAFALIKTMFKNRFFVPFELWGTILVDISSTSSHLGSFLRIFEESCRIAVEEKLESMKPNLAACNAALEGCCRSLESVLEAEKVLETMSVLGIKPDESSFGCLSYLYAIKGLDAKIAELEILMSGFGLSNKTDFYSNLICGYVKVDKLESVTETLLHCLREGDGSGMNFADEIYREVVKGFLKRGSVKELSSLIINSHKLETNDLSCVERSVGYGIVNACISLGYSDKAHSVLDEMNIQGGSAGLGVYLPILKAYGKEYRTAEATQLVMDITSSGLQLDLDTYDMLIESSMSNQDFQSALTLFRDMREARVKNLKGSYLTIMTGLMENQRPELMAAFLDEVVEDPQIEVGTHDWNSIIHAFCKSGQLEDASRTFRRMTFLRFEPNDQTYLSLISGYVTGEKYFNVLMLWNEVKRKVSPEKGKGIKFDHSLVDAFLYALVKGGFFDAVMQVVDRSQELKIFVDKWRYKQAFMENHKKLKVNKLRKKNLRKMEALMAFKNWAGLNA